MTWPMILFYIGLYGFIFFGFGYLIAKTLSPKCSFYMTCEFYRTYSETCNHGPQKRCGRYRELLRGEIET